jgi:hypothetical protein
MTVEVPVELIDPIEVPQKIDVRVIAASGEFGGRVDGVQRHFDLAAVCGDDLRVRPERWKNGGQENGAGD